MAVAVLNPGQVVPPSQQRRQGPTDLEKILQAVQIANGAFGIAADVYKIKDYVNNQPKLAEEAKALQMKNEVFASDEAQKQVDKYNLAKGNINTSQYLSIAGNKNLETSSAPAEGALKLTTSGETPMNIYVRAKKNDIEDQLKMAQKNKEEAQTELAKTNSKKGIAEIGKIKKESEGAGIKLPDTSWVAAEYAIRMENAEKNINRLIDNGFDPTTWQNSLEGKLSPEIAKSPEIKQFQQAMNDYATAKLRKQSGAAINKDEYNQVFRTDFAQAGDDTQTIAQKADTRAVEINSFKTQGSRAYDLIRSNLAGSKLSNPRGTMSSSGSALLNSAQAGDVNIKVPTFNPSAPHKVIK